MSALDTLTAKCAVLKPSERLVIAAEFLKADEDSAIDPQDARVAEAMIESVLLELQAKRKAGQA